MVLSNKAAAAYRRTVCVDEEVVVMDEGRDAELLSELLSELTMELSEGLTPDVEGCSGVISRSSDISESTSIALAMIHL